VKRIPLWGKFRRKEFSFHGSILRKAMAMLMDNVDVAIHEMAHGLEHETLLMRPMSTLISELTSRNFHG
jgi:hypothetical protein